MSRFQRIILLLLALLCLPVWAALLYIILTLNTPEKLTILPTLAILTTDAPMRPTHTPLPTASPTPTLMPTFTTLPSLTPTQALPTLATRVLEISAVMPGVYLPPTVTPFPLDVTVMPAPPNPYEPLPDATRQPPPYFGWTSFESDHPNVTYATSWERRLHQNASRGQYHRTEDVYSSVAFVFEGEGLRIRYVAARNMGIFQLVVDGVVIDTIDAYAGKLAFPGTRVYTVPSGTHLLELRPTGQKNTRSEGITVALDAIQVWRSDGHTLIIPPPGETLTPTPEPQPAAFELVSAPPTMQATATEIAPVTINASIVIGYDENGNRAIDPAEGVAGISVRLVEVGTNRALAQAFTDSSGYAQLQVVSTADVRLVVPYFGKVYPIPAGRRAADVRFTLLLPPGNQPGLIP
ncbi:MAG TPA: hypothetical protein PLQ56_16760 [Aggregatilineales bacterium]|nr:hypothetical protein [Aggregatilineales bacterium]